MTIPTAVTTERLLLRPPVVGDAQAILEEYAGDPEVTRFLNWQPHESVDTVREFLEQQVEAVRTGALYTWVVCVKPGDRPVGMIEFRRQGHSILVGYVLARRCWSQGLLAEALAPLVRSALAEPEIFRVWAFVDVENRASGRVLEKSGMQFEGILRRWWVAPNIEAAPRDCACYSAVEDPSR